MKRTLIAGVIIIGISLLITAIGAWLAPDLLDEPGGWVALFAGVFVSISALFGGKISEWADTLYGKKDKEASGPATSIEQEVNEVKGGVVAGTIGTLNYTVPPQPEVHDTIGFIPAAKVETYVHRGTIEEQVLSFVRNGGNGAIVGLHAPGGIGKTELAKRTAEALKDEFEVLWVDVGEKTSQQVIGEMLIKCGAQSLPTASYEKQRNELRHAYQSHRFLVILDDVRQDSLANLEDFLPPSPCSALVTSRIQQIGGVKTFPLGAMSWSQAQELFEAILGEQVVAAELDVLKQLGDRCRFNPLAMEIAARRIRQFQGLKQPVERYFEIAEGKFSELKMEGDARWDMRGIFDISYDDLSQVDQEKFRSLSVFHPSGFSVDAVSFIWQAQAADARQILSRFINLSLVKIVELKQNPDGLMA